MHHTPAHLACLLSVANSDALDNLQIRPACTNIMSRLITALRRYAIFRHILHTVFVKQVDESCVYISSTSGIPVPVQMVAQQIMDAQDLKEGLCSTSPPDDENLVRK